MPDPAKRFSAAFPSSEVEVAAVRVIVERVEAHVGGGVTGCNGKRFGRPELACARTALASAPRA